MKFYLHASKAAPRQRDAHRRKSILLAALAFAAFFVASLSAAQTRIDRDIAVLSQDSAAAPQVSAAAATPAEIEISAPAPNVEEASLVSPAADPFLLIAQDGGQSSSSQGSSSQSSSSTSAQPKPPAAKTKSEHRGLGVALAVVGSVALAAGVVAYAFGEGDFCGNVKSGGCPEARDAGLVLMPVGGGVAVTGFYLVFRH
jgi:hypothetical protein